MTVQGAASIRQYAALPYRDGPGGLLQVLLITSRDTRRWVLPKGNPIRGLAAHEAAAREAFEEAGIAGDVDPVSIGSYRYDKRRRDGTLRAACVEVFPMAVAGRYDDWPEQHQRDSRWFSLHEAAAAVDEPDLKVIIARFADRVAAPLSGSRLLRWLYRLGPGRGDLAAARG